MDYQAKWGPKGFIVSPDKIVTFNGFSTSIEMNDENKNDTSGRKLQTIKLSINYIRAAGVDPRAQFEEWSSLVGQAYPLYIGGQLFGPDNIMLKKVDLSGLELRNDGTFLAATVAVSFDEYTVVTVTKKAKKKTKTKKEEEDEYIGLTETQKAAYQQKTDRIHAERTKALETADEKAKEHRKFACFSVGNMVGGGGGMKNMEDRLTY